MLYSAVQFEEWGQIFWAILWKVSVWNLTNFTFIWLEVDTSNCPHKVSEEDAKLVMVEMRGECLSSVSSVRMLGSAITDHIGSRGRRPNSTTINPALHCNCSILVLRSSKQSRHSWGLGDVAGVCQSSAAGQRRRRRAIRAAGLSHKQPSYQPFVRTTLFRSFTAGSVNFF